MPSEWWKSVRGWSFTSIVELVAKFSAKNLSLSNEDEMALGPFIIVGNDGVTLLKILRCGKQTLIWGSWSTCDAFINTPLSGDRYAPSQTPCLVRSYNNLKYRKVPGRIQLITSRSFLWPQNRKFSWEPAEARKSWEKYVDAWIMRLWIFMKKTNKNALIFSIYPNKFIYTYL